MTVAGYAHPAYAHAVAGDGLPLPLSESGGWLIERAIPGMHLHDATGCYPIFACPRWAGLEADLSALPTRLIAVTLVTDPFGDHTPALLARSFPDRCVPYKEHHVTDLSQTDDAIISAHHRRNVRRATAAVAIEPCSAPDAFLDEWVSLYGNLARRHGIVGPASFSHASFAAQLTVPGLHALRATRNGETVGMTLWYEQGDVAYYHLGAYSDVGYEHRAAFALFAAALDHFRGVVGWLSLGAGAGVTNDGDDGLTRFKRGWATGTRSAYLCGRVLDRERYAALAGSPSTYFPAYRAPVAAIAAAE